MPRRKNTKPETIDDVIKEMSTAENSLNDEIKNIFSDNNFNEKSEKVKPEIVDPQNNNTNFEKKSDELLKLAEDGDLDKSFAYIKKASHKGHQ